MDVSLAGSDLYTAVGFALQEHDRPSARLRMGGYAIPGIDGYLTQLPTPLEHDVSDLTLEGFVNGTTAALRALILGSTSWRALVFSDLSPKSYQVQGRYVDETRPGKTGALIPVTIGFLVSPPCLLGAAVVDATSPVNNPGDYRCPAAWTIVASGPFTLTVGSTVASWTGGAGTVVINSETFRTYLDGVEAPAYHEGGFPWLAPGNNTVTCTPGFSCTFTPRYA